MTGPLRIELTRYAIYRVDDVEPGKDRRVEIVPEIEADGADRCLVMHSDSQGVRDVVEVALRIGGLVFAKAGILLLPGQKVVQHIARSGKDVSHVMEKGEANVVSHEGQVGRGQPQFELVQEQTAPSRWIARLQVTWSCLI